MEGILLGVAVAAAAVYVGAHILDLRGLEREGEGKARRGVGIGTEGLVGRTGVTLSPVAPTRPGRVRIADESWQAHVPKGAEPIAIDTAVTVVEVRDLSVVVQRADASPRATAAS